MSKHVTTHATDETDEKGVLLNKHKWEVSLTTWWNNESITCLSHHILYRMLHFGFPTHVLTVQHFSF